MNYSEKVVVVDDEPAVLKSLIRLLSSAGFDAHGVQSSRDLLESKNIDEFDCVVVDFKMPDIDGLELQRELNLSRKDCSIVFVSGEGDIHTSVSAMKGGAIDFLTKPVDADCLLAAVANGLNESRQRRNERKEIEAIRERFETLTLREKQVFKGVVEGLLNKQIGARLGTAEKTVKVQRAHVMEKMAARNVADLVRMATRARQLINATY
jgi:FixJ family two-component response regulator